MRVHNAAHGMRLLVLRTQSKKVDALDEGAAFEGAWIDGAGAAVGVPHSEGDLRALGVDEVHAAR